MSVIVFTPSLSKRKELLKIITHAHKQWKFRIALAVFLFVLSAAVIVGTAILLLMNPTTIEGILAFSGAGICFSSIPFFIALSVKNTAKYKCGFPYSSYANASLLLNDDSLEYVFWRVGPHEPAAYSSTRAVYRDEDKFTFTINKSDIANKTRHCIFASRIEGNDDIKNQQVLLICLIIKKKRPIRTQMSIKKNSLKLIG